MKLQIPSVSCTIGNPVEFAGEVLGLKTGRCPDPDWRYEKQTENEVR